MAEFTPLTDAESAQLSGFLTVIRHAWRRAANPESRADLERRLRDALLQRANAVMRRGSGRCEHCGDLDKDKRIVTLERQLDQSERARGRAWALLRRDRKTVSAEALRAALDLEAAKHTKQLAHATGVEVRPVTR